MMIRVVDDDRTTGDLLRGLLEHEDFTVAVTSTNFPVLLTPALWTGVDVAIIDLSLGDEHINGVHICAYLKTEHPHIRRVILTAADGAGMLKGRRVGEIADEVLTKPASFEQILKAVRG